ncbi:MAG: DUF1304 domain-containing protein [Hyphomicrobiales bacterium]|nr:DUF1304 domain-containing protein [Hyphomicrobiales bacterium]
MHLIASLLVGLVGLEHVYFLYLEMFRWTAPSTRAAFGTTAEFAEATKVLAANQGLYNGFLAAGLFWSLLPGAHALALQVFFLACVIIAGIYGGFSVKRSIWFIQALPAALALAATLIAAH